EGDRGSLLPRLPSRCYKRPPRRGPIIVGKDAVMHDAEPWDPERAARRIAQLEAALMRRNELLEQKTAALCNILESDAWKFVKFCHRLRDRLLPLRSRRRQAFKFALRTGLRTARWLTGKAPASGVHGLNAAPDQ